MIAERINTFLAASGELGRLKELLPSIDASTTEVGATLVMIASGKFDWSSSRFAIDRDAQRVRQHEAQRLIARFCFRPTANLYDALAISSDASHEHIRDGYRRMIALVHPDACPQGFPEQAATRVNLAYETLGDPARRAVYDNETLLTGDAVESTAAALGPRMRMATSPRAQPPRFRLSRYALLWLAAGLAVPSATLLYLAFVESDRATLIESHAGPTVTGAGAPAVPPPSPQTSAAPVQLLATATEATPGGASSAASETVQIATTAVAGQLTRELSTESKQRLRAAESTQTRVIGANPRPISTPVAVPPAVRPDLRPQLANPETVPAKTTRPPRGTSVAIATDESPPAALATTGVTLSNRTRGTSDVSPPAGATSDPPIDVDEVLTRLVTAYESGSTVALAALLSPKMPGRHAMLDEYERVFRSTTSRTLRLGQLRHQHVDRGVRSSGPATVVTIATERPPTEQRVFLDILVGREDGQIYIERLSSYVGR